MSEDQTLLYFVGAGPGDPELLTLKAHKIICSADLLIYAGSLVPTAIVNLAPSDCRCLDSAGMTLEQTHAEVVSAAQKKQKIVRLHTGDSSLFGAILEQMRLLEQDDIKFEIVPGVSAAFAAAAKAKVSFTVPEGTQSLIITRTPGRTPMPEKEELARLAASQTALAIYLSASQTDYITQSLNLAGYPPLTKVIIAHAVGWPQEKIIESTLQELQSVVEQNKLNRQTVFLVLPHQQKTSRSRLYHPEFEHGFRNKN